MVFGFTVLLLCQLAGEGLARGLGLPVPGPVLGLIILVIGLMLAHRQPRTPVTAFEERSVVRTADSLLANLSLLFVPAGVGVIDQIGVLRSQALAIGAALVVSTVLTLIVTVLVFIGAKRFIRPAPEGAAE